MRHRWLREVVGWRSTRCAANKLRSGLTVLGVVIGITSIVGMTSLIRGFDESLRDRIRAARTEHDLRGKVQHRQPVGGREFSELLRRPQSDGGRRQGDREAGAVGRHRGHDGWARAHADRAGARVSTGGERTPPAGDRRRHRTVRGRQLRAAVGWAASSPRPKSRTAGASSSSATTPYQALFAPDGHRPDRQEGAHRRRASTRSSACCAKRPSAGGFGSDQDDFVVIPQTTHRGRLQHRRQRPGGRAAASSATIAVVPQRHGHAGAGAARRSRRSCASATA